jgi:protein SCO1/2
MGLQAGRHARGVVTALSIAFATTTAVAQGLPWHDLALRDHREQPLRPAELAGRPVLLHFVFAGCTTACPVQVQELRALHDSLPAPVRERVVFLSVTVDPLGDTPQALAAYARQQGVDRPGWRFVSGPPAQVHRLHERLQAFDAQPTARRPDDHRTSLFLYRPDGQLLQRHRGVPVDRVRLADELTRLTRPAAPPATTTSRSPA